MANQSTVAIELKVNDNGSVTIKQFGDNAERALNKAGAAADNQSGSFSKLQGVIATLAGSYALLKSAQYIKEATDLAAKYELLGIQIDLEAAYRKFEQTNNMVTGSITAGQRPQAIMNELLKEGSKYAGLYEASMQTAAGQALSMQRHIENLKVSLGLAFTPALAELVQWLTGEVVGLNKELSGKGKDAVMDWGNSFRLALIMVRTELEYVKKGYNYIVMAASAADMAMFGPGAALGNKNSKKGFEGAAQSYLDAESSLAKSDAAIDQLAAKYVKLEFDMTAQGKSEIAWAAFVADAKIQSLNKVVKADEVLTEKQLTIRENFAKAHAKLTMSTEQAEIVAMNLQYAEFKKGAVNETQLEEWKQAELRNIRLRAQNEQLALYEELAKIDSKYADDAIAVYAQITAAKKEADALILKSDELATELMIRRNKDYVEKMKGGFAEIVQAEKEAIVETAALPVSSKVESTVSSTSGMGEYTGMPVGPSSGFTVYNVGGSVFYNLQAAQDYSQQIQAIADNSAEAAKAATEKAAQDAIAAAEEKARKLKEIADKNLDLNIQILELSGQAEAALTARRLLELSTLDESSQLLQRRVYYLQDEAEKATKAAADVAAAQALVVKAQQEAAKAAADLATAQDKAAISWRDSLSKLVSQGQAIKDFINSLGATGVSLSVGAARGAYTADLAGARAGDANSYQRVTQSAGAYINVAGQSAGNATDIARIVAQIKGELSALPPVVQLDANTELLKTINDHTEATATATGSLWLSGIKANFELDQIIKLVEDSTGLSDTTKQMLIAQTGDYKLWLKAALDSTVSDALKRVLIDGAGIYKTTVTAAAGEIDAKSQKLAIDATGDYAAYVNTLMGSTDLTEATKTLALTAGNTYLSTITQTLNSDLTPADKAIALTTSSDIQRTVTQIISSDLTTQDKAIALAVSTDLQRSVALMAGDTTLTDTDKQIALSVTGYIDKTINQILGTTIPDVDKSVALLSTKSITETINQTLLTQLTSEDKKVVLAISETITKSIKMQAIGGLSETDKKVLFSVTETISKTIDQILGSTLTDKDKSIALLTTDKVSKTIDQIYNSAMSDSDKSLALLVSEKIARDISATLFTSMSEQDKMLALAKSNDATITLTAKLNDTDTTTNDLQNLLKGVGIDTTVTGTWKADTSLDTILNAIQTATEKTAANTGMYTLLKATNAGKGEYQWEVFNGNNTLVKANPFNTSFYPGQTLATISETFRPRGFADGGDFSGGWRVVGERGPELEFTGPSSIVSTEKSKALVDNVVLIEEVRALRKVVESGNYQIAKNTGKTAKVLDRFDSDGLPETRAV